jgi:transketolase
MPKGWEANLPQFKPEDGPLATRAASGKVLNAAAAVFPSLMGGSADLAPSNKTFIDGSPEFQKKHFDGRNIRFGVREFAMGAVMSGMFLHGGVRPYGGTFPGLCRLHAPRHPPGGPDEAAGRLCVHPRQRGRG